ncbi:hypothetical protein [Chenggangzhangella methanolivorans]|nr:hypothetical protein [Chenggangzhangella methanolivorans]
MREGCDPRVVADPMFLAHPASGRYAPLDAELYDEVATKRLRV